LLANTGSWYQVLLKRGKVQVPTGFPPIKNFVVTSDFLNVKIRLSAQNIFNEVTMPFSVVNTDKTTQAIFSCENVYKVSAVLLSVTTEEYNPIIVFSAESI